ncbi:hypothetical protein B0F90DRAFT_1671519 [Multifurca ochricompacta]|uniref:Uncharacterized protein n=1 Tax=Multifurca ochricompacta TaxID=376703 RepID=A0AAD4LWW5_9AGAM|nr:hypothetical protein B0F90DRAFT_1671519 [Multifurca ochricompacta]
MKSANLEYQLVLLRTGMQDAQRGGPLLPIDRLHLLRKYEIAWHKLQWSASAAIPWLVGWEGPIAVSGGILVFRKPRRNTGTLQEFLCLRTPSRLRAIDAGYWNLRLPAEAMEICIDALQDLLIYMRLDNCLCVRKLSTDEVHPVANHDGVLFPPDGWKTHPGTLRICGSHVAVASDQGLYISTWDWKTGAHISEFLATAQQPAFEFLDENHIIFPGSNERQLCIYNLLDFPPFLETQSTVERVRACQIIYPHCGREGAIKHIQFKCNTLSTGVSTGVPFFMDPTERLLVVQVTTSTTQGGERGDETVELYIPTSKLLNCVATIPVPEIGQVALPCEPRMAHVMRVTAPHFVPPSAAHPSRFTVSGMRAIFSRPTWHKGRLVLRVADIMPDASHEAIRHTMRPKSRKYDDSAWGAGPTLAEGCVDRKQHATDDARPRQYFERSVPLPQSMQEDGGLSVSAILCEDAILLFERTPIVEQWEQFWRNSSVSPWAVIGNPPRDETLRVPVQGEGEQPRRADDRRLAPMDLRHCDTHQPSPPNPRTASISNSIRDHFL